MATIKINSDHAIVSGMCLDGSQFRKTYSLTRYGNGFAAMAREKYEELLFESSGLTQAATGTKSRNMRKLTVKDLGDRYTQEHLSLTKAAGNKSYIDVIIAKWGGWRLSQITIGAVRPWIHAYLSGVIRDKNDQPYSANYAKKLVRYFQRIFNWGCEGEIIDRNPLEFLIDHSLRKEFARRIKARTQTLSGEQFEKILAGAPLWFQRICRHAWGTGMREGEIAQLRWTAVDCEMIFLRSDETKEADVKAISMEPQVVDQIEAIRLEQSIEGKSEYIYLGESGLPVSADRISGSWRYYSDLAGFHDFVFHDLRRSWENRKEREGFSLRAIAAQLGHHSTDTTARHYRNVSIEEIKGLSKSSA